MPTCPPRPPRPAGAQTLGIGAAAIVPLELSGRVAGALSIADSREHVEWPDVLLPRAQPLGQRFASFTARQQAEQGEPQAQAQAAPPARVATLGVFATSLVHELTQPLAAAWQMPRRPATCWRCRRPRWMSCATPWPTSSPTAAAPAS